MRREGAYDMAERMTESEEDDEPLYEAKALTAWGTGMDWNVERTIGWAVFETSENDIVATFYWKQHGPACKRRAIEHAKLLNGETEGIEL